MMDYKEIAILKFMELIEKNHDQTQRAISKILDISLGNVNAMVKGLVESEFVEIRENQRNRVHYVITKKGGAEKVRLAYEYLNLTVKYICDVKEKIKKSIDELCRQNVRSLVFYGAEELAELAFVLLQNTPLELSAVIDSKLAGQMFFDKRVMPPSELSSLSFDKILVTKLDNLITIEHIIKELTISRDDLVLVV